jgi:hypothetical protein
VNLLPLLPLDGGIVVSAAVESLAPGRGRQITLIASITLTLGGLIVLVGTPRWRPLSLFVALLLLFQVMQLVGERAAPVPVAPLFESPGASAIERLLDRGEVVKAGQYGSNLYRLGGRADVAVLVARAAARLGEIRTSMAWLQAAAIALEDPTPVLDALETHPDFTPLRDDLAFAALHLVLGGT